MAAPHFAGRHRLAQPAVRINGRRILHQFENVVDALGLERADRQIVVQSIPAEPVFCVRQLHRQVEQPIAYR
jgi:hypothetical protein